MRRRFAVAGAAVLVSVLAGCGDDGSSSGPTLSPGSGAPTGAVEVGAEDIRFSSDAYDAAAGTVTFAYRNEGSIPHTLVIEGVDGFGLEVAGNGVVDEGSIDLDPGTYTLYCDVAGHREAGMEADLEVG